MTLTEQQQKHLTGLIEAGAPEDLARQAVLLIRPPELRGQITDIPDLAPTDVVPVPDIPMLQAERDTDNLMRTLRARTEAVGLQFTEQQETYLKQLQEQMTEKKTGIQALTAGIAGLFGVSRKAEFEAAFEEYGGVEAFEKVQQQAPKVAALRAELDQLDLRFQRDLEKAEQRIAPGMAIQAEQRRLEREYRRERADVSISLSAETLLLEAYRGNLQEAQQMGSMMAQFAAADAQFQAGILGTLIDIERDWYNSLEKDMRDYVSELRDFHLSEANAIENRMYQLSDDLISLGKANVTPPITTQQIAEMAKTPEGFVEARRILAGALATAQLGVDLSAFFSPEQLRDLRRKGIDPTTPEGFQKALDTVDRPSLSSTALTKMADRGLPSSIANKIQEYTLRGLDYHSMYSLMKEELGPEKAGDFIQTYRDTIRDEGVIQLKVPQIEIPEDFRVMGIEEAKALKVVAPVEKPWWKFW